MISGGLSSKMASSMAAWSVPSGHDSDGRSNSCRRGHRIAGSVISVRRCACGCTRHSAVSSYSASRSRLCTLPPRWCTGPLATKTSGVRAAVLAA
eukprot:scaffold20552_cov63-Phaeocystis_antarctica.AAC.3